EDNLNKVHHQKSKLHIDQTCIEQNNLQRIIMKNLQAISLNDKILYVEIINYKTFSRDGPVIFSTLPVIRMNWLQKLLE
ncbi:unnamed protein product, partial [Rotaria sp. Silwood1]